ncbi:uncharacterized protein LOC134279720 [Saccostrea cucullata]|uniref:uncharacterized protein LOC134279720 n=1 Tax=Saccostrea cuccullata TaxID=36930 RepID=UPI002ECFE119
MLNSSIYFLKSNFHCQFSPLIRKTRNSFIKSYTVKTPEAASCPPIKPLIDEPELIIIIDTGYDPHNRVTRLSDEEIWTCGEDKIMKLCNLQGKLLKTIQTKSGNIPGDIAVTRSGDLVYTDHDTRTINIVKNKQIQEVIRLQGVETLLHLQFLLW